MTDAAESGMAIVAISGHENVHVGEVAFRGAQSVAHGLTCAGLEPGWCGTLV